MAYKKIKKQDKELLYEHLKEKDKKKASWEPSQNLIIELFTNNKCARAM